MKYWVNFYKDPPDVWAEFNTKQEAIDYISCYGYHYSLCNGDKFDQQWIEDERMFREGWD